MKGFTHDRSAFDVLSLTEGREGGGGGGGPNPISQEIVFFFQIPAQIPQSQPVLLKLKSHSHFLLFFFHESQSQSTKSHFPASKKGKSQLPFYPFTTLLTLFVAMFCSQIAMSRIYFDFQQRGSRISSLQQIFF